MGSKWVFFEPTSVNQMEQKNTMNIDWCAFLHLEIIYLTNKYFIIHSSIYKFWSIQNNDGAMTKQQKQITQKLFSMSNAHFVCTPQWNCFFFKYECERKHA